MSRYINAWLHWAIYNIILLAVSLLYVHAHDIELRYTQQGQPGPNGTMFPRQLPRSAPA